jgi:hypothetical protein
MLVRKSAHAIKCMAATAMPQGSKAGLLGEPWCFGFLNCGENGPDDILKFP